MTHHAAPSFWTAFANLSSEVQKRAKKNFALLKSDPQHPSLRFKRVGRYWSARVGDEFRAVAVEAEDGLVRFWIGPHGEYERLIAAR